MREIRLYLLILLDDREFDISVHRDVEGLRKRWEESRNAEPWLSALVHAGFSRPSTDEIRETLEQYEGRVLISAAARWLLPPACEERPHPTITLNATERVKAMPLHIATKGWGYTLQDPSGECGSDQRDEAAEETIQEVRRAFADALKSVNRADPFAISLIVPAWLRSVPVDSLHVGTRCSNVLSQQRIRVVEDLAYYKMNQAQEWRGFGAESAARLANGLIQAAMDRSLEAKYYSSAKTKEAPSGENGEQDRNGFEQRLSRIDQQDPHAVLDVLPDWVLEAPIDALPLTVRCENVIRRLDVERVGDLCQYTTSYMLKWRNFGRKSVRDLADSLIAAARTPRPGTIEHGSDADCFEAESGNEGQNGAHVPTSLLEHVQLVASSWDERAAHALIERLGLKEEPPTFEKLGDEMGVTRERVRQIEHRAWQHVQKAGLGTEALERLANLLSDREGPLFADLLHVEDDWFKGLHARALRRFLGRACDNSFSVIEIAGRPIISILGQGAWEQLIDQGLTFASMQATHRAPMSEVRLGIEALATGAGVPELASTLYHQTRQRLNYGQREEDAEPVLVAVGPKIENIVSTVLYEAAEPLHIDEILARCQKRDESIGYGSVHRACQENALRFSHGVYGTEAHIRLGEEKQRALVEAAVEIVRSGPPGRQWHAAGLLEHLIDAVDSIPEVLDKYVLDALLTSRSSLTYLGRMTWAGSEESSDRIEIMEAAEVILQRAEGPLPKDQLEKAISEHRGTGDMEVLWPNERVVRIAPGVWGLASRDAQLRGAARDRIFSRLAEILRAREHGLHESELIGTLESSGVDVPVSMTGYGIMNLLHLSPDLHLYRGRLVGLAEWDEPRRLTLSEALEAVVGEIESPQPMGAIVERVRERLGRPVDMLNVRNGLYHLLDKDSESDCYLPALDALEEAGS